MDRATAIVTVLGFNSSHVRPSFTRRPFASYIDSVRLVMRLVISLRRVHTELPIVLLASGERHAAYEAAIAAQGVTVVAGSEPAWRVPRWASPWARGSFVKLQVLALTEYERIVVLDNDVVALRNIDHLASSAVETPAFVLDQKMMNSGVMLLAPSAAEHARMQAFMQRNHSLHSVVRVGGGDQAVWHTFYPRTYELPAGYNAAGISNLSEADWARVHIAHPLGRGGCGSPHPARTSAPACRRLMVKLTAEAAELLAKVKVSHGSTE